MLTGDNPFTAVNIAHSCGLIERSQKTFIVNQDKRNELKEEFDKILDFIKKNKKYEINDSDYFNSSSDSNENAFISSSNSNSNEEETDFCLVITGDALKIVQQEELNKNEYLDKNVKIENNKKTNDCKNLKHKENEENVKNQIKITEDEENTLYKKTVIFSESDPENKKREFKNTQKNETEMQRCILEEHKNYEGDFEDSKEERSKSINSSKESIESDSNEKEKVKYRNTSDKKINENINNKKESKNNQLKNESSKSFEYQGIEEGTLIELFEKIINSTNTVICSRVSPKQKADLVILVKKFEKENMTTLAIGDGANDVNMITAADVGIGILGNEGQQAARASDYVIGQFSFLKRLLFVHGREAQRKNAFAIGYILWKNFLYVVPMIIFGFFSYFSSQMLYDPYIDICYNILFTAYPIGWFATYDKERNYDELENNPKYYRKGLENGYFNSYIFWQWYFYGLIGGILIFWFVSIVYLRNNLQELWLIGHTVLLCIILVVNTKLLIKSKSHNFLSILLFIFSNSIYILILYIYNYSNKLNVNQFFTNTFDRNITFYLLIILIVSACMMGEYAWEASMTLLQSFIGVIQKTVSDVKNKKVKESKKKTSKKEFESLSQKEKEDKSKLEQDLSRDHKIDFYISEEERPIPAIKFERDDNIIEDFNKNVDEEILTEGGKSVDNHLLGYRRRYTGFCMPEDKPDIDFINQILIENFVDEKLKKIQEERLKMIDYQDQIKS